MNDENNDWSRYMGAQATPELYAARGGNEYTLVEDLKHLWGDPNQGEDYLTDEEIQVVAERMMKVPKPPSWVRRAGKEAIWAWENSLDWRAGAAQATTKQYRRFLIKQATDAYHN